MASVFFLPLLLFSCSLSEWPLCSSAYTEPRLRNQAQSCRHPSLHLPRSAFCTLGNPLLQEDSPPPGPAPHPTDLTPPQALSWITQPFPGTQPWARPVLATRDPGEKSKRPLHPVGWGFSSCTCVVGPSPLDLRLPQAQPRSRAHSSELMEQVQWWAGKMRLRQERASRTGRSRHQAGSPSSQLRAQFCQF